MIGSRKTLLPLAVCIAVLAFGCAKKGDSSASTLDPRFQATDAVQFVQDGISVLATNDVSAFASSLQISLALTVNPPSTALTDGVQVYASDLSVYGNKVIAGYNTPGAVEKGWIDLIDVTLLAVPVLTSSYYFSDTDINGVAVSNGKFAVVGAKNGTGSVLRTGTIGLTGLTVSPTETFLSSYAGTGITYDATGANLAVTTGDAGGVAVVNASTLISAASYGITDARAITYNATTNKYYAVKGQTGEVHSFDVSGNHLASVSIGGATIAHSKSSIVSGSEFLLATSGDGGFSVICAADLGIAAHQAQYVYANYAVAGLPDPTQTVSNAAAFGPGMIFVAAGQAGVRVYNFVKKTGASPTACQNIDVSYMGYFDFNNALSANNLVYANVLTTTLTYTGVLYVASGSGGFKAVTVVANRSALNDIIQF